MSTTCASAIQIYTVDRVGDWADVVSSTFVPLECRGRPQGFRAALHSRAAGDLHLTRIRVTAHEVARTRRAIRRCDPGGFKVVLQRRGIARMSQDDRQARLCPGDLAIYDTSRPYSVTMEGDASFEFTVLMFPTTLLGIPADAMRRVTSTRVAGREGLGALVSPFLSRLVDGVLADDTFVSARLVNNAMDLVETLYRQRLDLPPGEPDCARSTRLLMVKAWIRRNLDRPDLTPGSVAAAHHLSVRYLYRLFEADGTTVARWIKEQRLEGCRNELADPALARFSVSGVAARWGMLDPTVFSRSFRTAYGESPRAYRTRHLSNSSDVALPQAGGVGQAGTGSSTR